MEKELYDDFKKALQTESSAISKSLENINEDELSKAISLLNNCKGKIILSGLGKSGFIAKKIASTFTSIGMIAIYLHPSEALHGDFGITQTEDLAILISKSGETEEILRLIPFFQHRNVPFIAMAGNMQSTLAKSASVTLNCSVEKEADFFNILPTSSTTVALAFGDALAVVLMKQHNVTPQKFAFNHPSGSLGKQLTVKVKDIFYNGDNNPVVKKEDHWLKVIEEMNKNSLGAVNVISEEGKLIGIITDGDIRRLLKKMSPEKIKSIKSKDIMSTRPVAVLPDTLVYDALVFLKEKNIRISALSVADENNYCIGLLRISDIHKLGVVV